MHLSQDPTDHSILLTTSGAPGGSIKHQKQHPMERGNLYPKMGSSKAFQRVSRSHTLRPSFPISNSQHYVWRINHTISGVKEVHQILPGPRHLHSTLFKRHRTPKALILPSASKTSTIPPPSLLCPVLVSNKVELSLGWPPP